MNNDPKTYQAKIITGFPGNSVEYNDGQRLVPVPLTVTDGDKIRFELWQQTIEYALQPKVTRTQILDGDLVLIAQYSAPTTNKSKKSRKSHFNSGDSLAFCLKKDDKAKSDDAWTLDIKLNGAKDQTHFEYCIIVLLENGSRKIVIDPSIIINP